MRQIRLEQPTVGDDPLRKKDDPDHCKSKAYEPEKASPDQHRNGGDGDGHLKHGHAPGEDGVALKMQRRRRLLLLGRFFDLVLLFD